jgi:hypothetical protein
MFAAVTGDELVAGRDAVDVALSTLMNGVTLEPRIVLAISEGKGPFAYRMAPLEQL